MSVLKDTSGPAKGTMRIYACGGGGLNIVSDYMSKWNFSRNQDCCAGLDVVYVDTSRSNVPEAPHGKIHIIDDNRIDGSGSRRSSNLKAIKEHIKPILVDYEPNYINVLVYTASGGSGSVIGPLLHAELLAMGERAITLLVGDTTSTVSAKNNLDTLLTLDGIVQRQKRNLVFYYEHNDPENPKMMDTANVRIFQAIDQLRFLFSRMNKGLDTADLENWLDFNGHLRIEPTLARLRMESKNVEDFYSFYSPDAVASLHYDTSTLTLRQHSDYSCYGFLPANVQLPDLDVDRAMFFFLNADVSDLMNYIQEDVAHMQKRRDARGKIKRYASSDQTDEDGMVIS